MFSNYTNNNRTYQSTYISISVPASAIHHGIVTISISIVVSFWSGDHREEFTVAIDNEIPIVWTEQAVQEVIGGKEKGIILLIIVGKQAVSRPTSRVCLLS